MTEKWTNNGRSVYRVPADPAFLLVDEEQATRLVEVLNQPCCVVCGDELTCENCEDIAPVSACQHPISEVGRTAVMNGTVTMSTVFKCYDCGAEVEPGRGYESVQMGRPS